MGLLNGPPFEPFLGSKERKESRASAPVDNPSAPDKFSQDVLLSIRIHCFALDILAVQRVQVQFFLITSNCVC